MVMNRLRSVGSFVRAIAILLGMAISLPSPTSADEGRSRKDLNEPLAQTVAAEGPADGAVPPGLLERLFKTLDESVKEIGPQPLALDRIDRLAPTDTKQTATMRRVQSLVQQQDWERALEAIQLLLSRESGLLYRQPDGQLTPMRRAAERLLGQFPEQAMRRYQLQYGASAERLLADGQQTGDFEKFLETATKYFHTPAGYRAADWLGSYHLDRGEFGMAVRWFEPLLEAPTVLTGELRWKAKAAFAFRRAGREDRAADLAQAIESAHDEPRVTLGGRRVPFSAWLQACGTPAKAAVPILEDWPLLYGTSGRIGTAKGGRPLLLPRWKHSHSTTTRLSLHDQIEELVSDLADQGRALIPASVPIVVDGKAVCRTLRGVQVVDTVSGQLLWETDSLLSPERQLVDDPPSRGDHNGQRQQMQAGRGLFGNPFGSPYMGVAAERHPLTNLLFRDGASGVLSCDGQRVFVVENPLATDSRQSRFGGFAALRGPEESQDRSSNRLTAYDLASGRPLWQVGGTGRNEPFDLPLAGTHFLGAPLPDGDQLFVVGERNDGIRLFSMDPQTGQPEWSQLIASCEARIEKDVNRRWWTAQVSTGQGVIVCPTTVGLLVAVARADRSVLWAYRYSRRALSNVTAARRNSHRVPAAALNARWCSSAPVIVGNHVVYTPYESTRDSMSERGTVVCLDLCDGHRIWESPKSDFLYLAAADSERVLLVGGNSIAAVSLERGALLWRTPIPPDAGRPSGRGVLVGERYHLPLQSGRLWTIRIADGSVESRSYLPEGREPLGNLVLPGDSLLSLGPLGLMSFEQREVVTAKIQKRRAQNPRDPWALLREADIHLLQRDAAAALQSLRQVGPEELTPEFRQRHRELLWTSLCAVIRSDYLAHDRETEDLKRLVESAEERLEFARLKAERLEARKQYEAAFDVYWECAQGPVDGMLTRWDDSLSKVRRDVWLSGRLTDLWNQATPEARGGIEARIRADADRVIERPAEEQERFLSVFGFHPATVMVQRRLAEQFADEHDFLRAENLLLQLAAKSEPTVAAAALERLARLLRDAGLLPDSGTVYRRLAHEYGNVVVGAKGQRAAQLVDELTKAGSINAGPFTPSWEPFVWRVVRTSFARRSPSIRTKPLLVHADYPYFRTHQLQYGGRQAQNRRLNIIGLQDGALAWSLPLLSRLRPVWNGISVATSGHQVVLLHQDVLHGISPVERKLAWTQSMETRSGVSSYDHYRATRRRPSPLARGREFADFHRLGRWRPSASGLVTTTPQHIAYAGRRHVTVLDTVSGRVRWSRTGTPLGARVFGSEEILVVAPREPAEPFLLRTCDGKRLAVANLETNLSEAIHVVGTDFVMARGPISGENHRSFLRLERYDPFAGRVRWHVEYPVNAYFSFLQPGSLLIVLPSGELNVLDLQTGARQELDAVSPDDLKAVDEIHAVTDHENLYLVINDAAETRQRAAPPPNVRVNGQLIAFDRKTGTRLWQHRIEQQSLVLDRLHQLPVLLLGSGTVTSTHHSTHLLVLDKRTGRKLVEETVPTSISLGSLRVSLAERFIELQSSNQRIRLIAEDRQASLIP